MVSHLISLCLSFLICEMGLIELTSQVDDACGKPRTVPGTQRAELWACQPLSLFEALACGVWGFFTAIDFWVLQRALVRRQANSR